MSEGGRFKGFRWSTLESFGVTVDDQGIVSVPYLTRAGRHYRTKLFCPDGSQRWAGEHKPLIPYGAETLARYEETIEGKRAFLTEGESDAWALRLAFPRAAVLGIPGANGWKSEWAALLQHRIVFLSFDGDRAGKELLDQVAGDLPDARRLLLFEDSDTREVLQRLGRAAYNVLVEEAEKRYEFWRVSRDIAALREQGERLERQLREAA